MPRAYQPKSDAQRSKLADQIFDNTLKELLRRLKAPALCSHCGSKGIVASEISALLKYLTLNDIKVQLTKPMTKQKDALDLLIDEDKREKAEANRRKQVFESLPISSSQNKEPNP
jgi:hypothetical protein